VQTANNNLDFVRHQGRVYLAWRSAPSHFASAEVVMNVASSEDEVTWRYETSFRLHRDLREPRFLSLGDRLFLYMARLGDNAFDFRPDGVSVSERAADGSWSQLEPTGPKGAIAWRVKSYQGEGLMVLYRGGENLYSFNGEPTTVELWRSKNGRDWPSFSDKGAVVLSGGGSETDFAVDAKSNTLFAVVRNEAGDASGAPLVFEHDGEVYVVGRRNLSGDGRYAVSTQAGALQLGHRRPRATVERRPAPRNVRLSSRAVVRARGGVTRRALGAKVRCQ
jgi:hypothetical protein